MGIQIYINKEAIEAKGIEIVIETEKRGGWCDCQQTEEGFCSDCFTTAPAYIEEYAIIQGLPTMHNFGDKVWSDANSWGSNRASILEFINKNGLLAGSDWYEA